MQQRAGASRSYARPAGPWWIGEDVGLPGDRAGSEQAAARAARRDAPGPGVAGQRAGCDLPMGRNMTARAACRGRGHPAARHAPVESGLHRCPARRRTVFIGRVRGADRGRRAVERVRGSGRPAFARVDAEARQGLAASVTGWGRASGARCPGASRPVRRPVAIARGRGGAACGRGTDRRRRPVPLVDRVAIPRRGLG